MPRHSLDKPPYTAKDLAEVLFPSNLHEPDSFPRLSRYVESGKAINSILVDRLTCLLMNEDFQSWLSFWVAKEGRVAFDNPREFAKEILAEMRNRAREVAINP